MLIFKLRGFTLRVDWSFLALIALVGSSGGEWSLTAAVCLSCAILHEFGHAAAMLWCGVPPDSLTLCAAGMILPSKSLACGKKAVCAVLLAGPAVNLCCAAAFADAAFGACSLGLGLFNLLPFEGSDGWQLIAELTGHAPPRAVKAAAVLTLAALCALSVYSGAFPLPLIAVTALMLASAVDS